MTNAATLHTIKPSELFVTFNIKPLQMTANDIAQYDSHAHVRKFAERVFVRFMKYVVDDIIDNGTQFQFSRFAKGSSFLYLERITGTDYQKIRKRGAFKEFDPVDTNFSAYRIAFRMERKNGTAFSIQTHLDHGRTRRIAKHAADGTLKAGVVKVYQDYVDIVNSWYPTISRQDIGKILRFGCTSFRLHMFYGADILIKSKEFVMQTGKLFFDKILMMKYVLDKMKVKIRVMYRKLHFLWDGYTYFSLTRDRYNAIKDDFEAGKTVDFGDVFLHKCYDEAFVNAYLRKALFKIKAGDPSTKFRNKEHLVTDQAELIEILPDVWDWSTMDTPNRKYVTILTLKTPVQRVYNKNKQPYIDWLRAKRWKELRK